MPDLKDQLNQALALHRQGRLGEAEKAYRAILLQTPGHGDALALLGMLLAQSNRAEAGLKLLREAAAQRPQAPDLQCNLGHAARMTGAVGEAEAAYRKALEVAPGFHDAALSLGALLEQEGRLLEALAHYESLSAPSPMLLFNFASTLNKLGKIDEAEAALRQAIAQEPRFLEAYANLANIRLRRGAGEEAVGLFRQAIGQQARAPQLHVGLGNCLYRMKSYEEAAAAFRQALTLKGDHPEALAGYVNALRAAGRKEEALNFAERAEGQAAAPARLSVDLAILLEEEGRDEEALAALRRAIAKAPADVRAHSKIGPLLRKLGQNEEVARLFAFDDLIYQAPLATPAGFESLAGFNQALAAYIQARSDHIYEAAAAATKGGSQTGELLDDPAAVIQALKTSVEEAVRKHLAAVEGAKGLPYFQAPPKDWHLISNAVVLNKGGYQDPHVHVAGYYSGVYYVEIPEEISRGNGEEGCIFFGDADQREKNGPETLVRPQEGLLCLFPSYAWHGTVPFQSDAKRICIAFDIVPSGRPAANRDAVTSE